MDFQTTRERNEDAIENHTEVLPISDNPTGKRDERKDPEAINNDKDDPASINNLSEKNAILAPPNASDNDEDEEDFTSLSLDTYGLLLMSNPECPPFWSALFVCCFQIILIGMILTDLLSKKDPGDPPFNPPTDVSGTVQVGQVMALIISVFTQNDMVEAIELLVYSPSDISEYTGSNPLQVLVVNLVHFAVGILGLFIVLVVVIQAENIMELFANFAAMQFVSNIDEIFFYMANRSYFGKNLSEYTENLKKIKIPSTRVGTITKQLFLFLPMIVILSFWFVNKRKTDHGIYFAPKYTVSIPDNFDENDSYLSGVYHIVKKCRENKKFFYVRDKIIVKKEKSIRGVIAYCEHTQRWNLNYYVPKSHSIKFENICEEVDDDAIYDPCKNVILQSPRTDKYSFEDISPSLWFIRVPTGGFTPVPSFFNFVSNECHGDSDCSSLHKSDQDGKIMYGGTCLKNNNANVLMEDLENLANIQSHAHFYMKSILMQLLDDDTQCLTLYQGIRYIQYCMPISSDGGVTYNEIMEYVQNNTSYIFKDDAKIYLSEQTDAGSPAGLDWYDIVSDAGTVTNRKGGGFGIFKKTEFRYVCPSCDITGISCGSHGECINGVCQCSDEYSGSLCQIAPTFPLTLSPTLSPTVEQLP
eukprot:CAMPEP_0113314048 /NCGR_PEP_ID=MMETSP0010_2-20120614/10257_1 /TAXON_ID=216773 ORGANISM="Corethron hystrix, Strain 308" /NCGR_SAMPLE_ID=MMETSP0010_2 /ASSEMBLY_ACC=CAM_ASM_000155 /LENGTH=641 /DNA_ID=CAMNT_0000170241 /DNA_START=133 /DNA_END=2059 /DNA_ORIENTATION=+ /assembly_acc=CAM_ASM_000155